MATMERRVQGTREELREMLREFDTALLVTLTAERALHARPMAMQDLDAVSDCDLWFVTERDTAKIDEISHDGQVAVGCYRPRDKAYVTISAMAKLDHDEATIRRLWKPEWSAWLSEGVDRTSVAIIKLRIERAEYWAPQGGRVRILYERLKSAVKGDKVREHLNPPKQV